MLQATILNTGSSTIYFFCQWFTTVLAVRFADFETAGIYALAISFTNLFYFLALFGIRNYQLSDIAGRFSEGQYFAARMLAAFVAVASFFATVWVSRLSAYTFGCYAVYMLFKLGEAYTEGYFPLLQLREDYRTLALSYTAKGVFPAAAFAAALRMTHDLLTAIICLTAGYGLCILLLDFPHLCRMRLQKPEFRRCGAILWNCVPLLLVSLSAPVMNYVTRSAVDLELGERLLGQYASLSSVIVVMSTFSGAVFVVFLPNVSRWKECGKWRRIYIFCRYALIVMAIVGAIAMIVGKLAGPWVCAKIFGEEILENIALLVPLLATSTVLMVKSFFSALLIPLEMRWLLLCGECSGAVLCATLANPLTRAAGLQGTNLSYLIGALAQAFFLAGGVFRTVRVHEKNTLSGE